MLCHQNGRSQADDLDRPSPWFERREQRGRFESGDDDRTNAGDFDNLILGNNDLRTLPDDLQLRATWLSNNADQQRGREPVDHERAHSGLRASLIRRRYYRDQPREDDRALRWRYRMIRGRGYDWRLPADNDRADTGQDKLIRADENNRRLPADNDRPLRGLCEEVSQQARLLPADDDRALRGLSDRTTNQRWRLPGDYDRALRGLRYAAAYQVWLLPSNNDRTEACRSDNIRGLIDNRDLPRHDDRTHTGQRR